MKWFYIIMIALCLVAGIGWIKNLIALANCNFDGPYQAEVIRGVGVVIAPIGAVAGYMDIED